MWHKKILSLTDIVQCAFTSVLDDKQESCLIEIMVCCVKQAATGEYPVGRGTAARKVTSKETKQVGEDKRALTDHFIVTLPQLLAKVCTVFLLRLIDFMHK